MNVKIEESGGGSHIAPKSKYNEVVKFFPVCVDNFFDNPDKIVRYAKKLPKESKKNPAGTLTIQTEPLWTINEELNYLLILKILSCYYDLSYQSLSWTDAEVTFKEHPAASKNKNDARNKGWIHFDQVAPQENTPCFELAGLIYLTPDIDPNAGTSLFMWKPSDKEQDSPSLPLFKDLWLDEDLFTKKHKEHEDFFIEKTRFANIYNRMIMYDTNEFHRANSYYSGKGKDTRLTLVFFIGGLKVESYPLEKIKSGGYDEGIEHHISSHE